MLSVRTNLLLWFAFLGAAVAWFALLLVNYGLVEIECKSAAFAFTILGLPGLTALLLAVTVLMSVISVLAGLAGWRNQRNPEAELEGAAVTQRARFMARTGLYSTAVFLLVIIVTTLPVFFMRPCIPSDAIRNTGLSDDAGAAGRHAVLLPAAPELTRR